MGCCVEDSVRVSKMALELKSGPMLWHKRRLFGSNWRGVYSVLYNDSSFLWFKDKSRQEQEGGIVLKEAPELIAFGPYTSAVPDRPNLPDDYEQKELLAFGVRGKDVVFWFLCPNEQEVESWMAAISSAFPPPPVPPQLPQQQPGITTPIPDETQYQVPTPNYVPSQAPTPNYIPPQYVPPRQPLPNYANQAATGIPGQYPSSMNYRPPPYQAYPRPQYANTTPGNTTVVVQQDRPGYIAGGGGGDFAMGMLLGGAIGTTWGATHHYGWGTGWGHGPSVHDTDIHINNYYDNDTSIVNNNLDMTNNVAIEHEAPVVNDVITGDMEPIEDASGGMFDGGDFDGDFGGGDFGGF